MAVKQVNPNVVVHPTAHNWATKTTQGPALQFHQSLPGYAPTKLIDVPQLAQELGLGKVLVKDESARFGLPAFKALGATWAIDKALRALSAGPDAVLVTATDGNHGRAVARTAKLRGLAARIYIPDGVSDFAIQAIADEGAKVTRINGDYDLAVAAAAKDAEETGALLIQDTAWDGYEEVPSWIVEGYSTMVAEVDQQLAQQGLAADLVIVPTGVGSLLQAVIAHYRGQLAGAKVVSVEPDTAGGVFESLKAGQLVSVATKTTIMTGLNCGTPSSLAMPYILQGLSGSLLVDDREARAALAHLTELGVKVGPCGAAALSGIRTLMASDAKTELGLNEDSVVVLLSTESAEANPI
jgi:diaminopropionate ammonia-lyase